MTCRAALRRLPLLAGDDLSPRARDRVLQHVAGCARCREEERAFRDWQAAIRGAEEPAVTEAELASMRAAVRRRIAGEDREPRHPRRKFLPIALPVAATLAALALGARFFGDNRPVPEPPPTPVAALPATAAPSAMPTPMTAASSTPLVAAMPTPPAAGVVPRAPAVPPRAIAARERSRTDPVPAMPTPPAPETVQASAPLRIELQTGNPNVRVIWFVHPSAPAADGG